MANIARVHTLTIRPRRKEAAIRFLKNLVVLAALSFGLVMLSESVRDIADVLTLGWLLIVILAIGAVILLFSVLGASSTYVLSVETAGPASAVITGNDRDALQQLVRRITYAIDHPEADFQVTVSTLTINPKNYYFGDNVNMYGGTANAGIVSS